MSAAAAAKPLAEPDRLPILAAGINDHLAAADAATKRGLEHAIAAGMLLIEAKNLVDHGDWLAWLEANCRVGVRQAQTFMRLAGNRHKLEAIKNESAAYLTIATAEALVGRSKPERPHGLPGQLDMLGGPEVTLPKAPALRGRALFDLVTDLEQALAIVQQQMTKRTRAKTRGEGEAFAGSPAALLPPTRSAATAFVRPPPSSPRSSSL